MFCTAPLPETRSQGATMERGDTGLSLDELSRKSRGTRHEA